MIDIDKLKKSYLMDDSSVIKLIKIFEESTLNDLIEIDFAIESKNEKEISKYAHKIKSSFSYFYLDELILLFEEIENLAKSKNDFSAIESLYIISKTKIQLVFKQIDEIIAKSK